jgi:uncharacterized membrane protein (UPF0127 family)
MIPWLVLSSRTLAARLTLALALAATTVTLPSCKNSGAPRPATGVAPADAATGAVAIETPEGQVPFHVELARTEAERERGLMFRQHLDNDAGMLFLFERPGPLTFWMKNTLIPLDMIFISADRTIVGIVENAEPQTLTSRGVSGPSQFVLEIAGGLSAKRGIKAGQRVLFRGVDAP